jgi:hypothetical protein
VRTTVGQLLKISQQFIRVVLRIYNHGSQKSRIQFGYIITALKKLKTSSNILLRNYLLFHENHEFIEGVWKKSKTGGFLFQSFV